MATRPVKRFALDVRGSLNVEPADPARPPARYVYQRVRAGLGNVSWEFKRRLQLRLHVIPYDPRTLAQLQRRALFADAIFEWRLLSPAQRDYWRKRGAPRCIPAYGAFLSYWLKK